MPPPQNDSDALIAALAEEARNAAGDGGEPTPEELLAYLAGRLPPAEEERLGRQLTASPGAAQALLDLADLEAAGEAAGEGPADLATRAGWRDFERRLPAAAVPTRPSRPPAWLAAVAASLLVTTLGLTAYVVQLRGERQRPIPNLPSRELAESRAAAEPEVVLQPGVPLRLTLTPAERCPAYTAEVAGPAGYGRKTIEGMHRDDLGRLTPLLPGLVPGAYNVRLAGCGHTLGEYRFRTAVHGD